MKPANVSFAPPRGMRDFYPEDMRVRHALFDAWRRSAEQFGFLPYDACVVESLDLLRRKAGEEIVEQIYAFTDKSGRELALRPEMTPTLARMIAARQGSLSLPIKWSTIAQCFRYERMTRGRKREHYQWNLDVIGEDSVLAEVEVVAAAVHALSLMGLEQGHYRVRFSNRALLSELLQHLGVAADHHAAAFLALDKRGKIADDQISQLLHASGVDAATAGRVLEILAISSLDEVAAVVGDKSPALSRTREFAELADAAGISGAICFDVSVIRGLAYYTGIVFEAFDSDGKFRAIFGGGRYDDLLGDVGGRPATGVGLGFGDVVVAELLADRGAIPGATARTAAAVGYMDDGQRTPAVKVAAALRRKGGIIDLATHAEKARAFFARVGNGDFSEAIYIGPDDLVGGTIRIKDLATRQDRAVAVDDILRQP